MNILIVLVVIFVVAAGLYYFFFMRPKGASQENSSEKMDSMDGEFTDMPGQEPAIKDMDMPMEKMEEEQEPILPPSSSDEQKM